VKLPILNYHGFETRPGQYDWLGEEKPYVVTAETFSAQLEEMVRCGFRTLELSGIKAWKEGNIPEKAVVITFDDGLKSHGEVAAPILEKAGFKGLFFIPVKLVGQKGHMDWNDLKDLSRRGFEIGSHGWRHVPLTQLPESEVREEFVKSKAVLEEKLGVPVKSFSIPRGFYNESMRAVAREAGYEYLFTSTFDTNSKDCDLFELKRMVVKRSTASSQFAAILEGNLGLRRTWEKMKEMVRGNVPPAFYDALAAAKRMGE
jgi:peptidoglycan/xylan/chitin deacetylase (PgdA/CDA1 family)